MISNQPRLWQEALKQFGLYLGLSFQIRDDILDFSGSKGFGKAFGQDLMQGIYTLPVLRAAALTLDRDMIALAEKKDKTPEDLVTLRDWVVSSGGLASAEEVAVDLNDRALAALDPLPACSAKATLLGLASSLGGREK